MNMNHHPVPTALSGINPPSVLIIGYGSMAKALAQGWSTVWPHYRVWAIGRYASYKFDDNAHSFLATDPSPAIDIVIIATKPQDYSHALGTVASLFNKKDSPQPPPIIVSVCAGITIATLESTWQQLTHDKETVFVRAMPNLAVSEHNGVIGLYSSARESRGNSESRDNSESRGEKISSRDNNASVSLSGSHNKASFYGTVNSLMAPLGAALWLREEEQLHAVTAISGSGPAYIYLLIEAMMQAAQRQGLPANMVPTIVTQTVIGAAYSALGATSTDDVTALRQRIVSPGGTTAAALQILQHHDLGLSTLIDRAVGAASERSKEIGDTLQKNHSTIETKTP